MKMHVKRNDIVKVLAGKDRGKQGKVIRVLPQRERVIVEGVNLAKRHVKARARNQKGGIVDKEMPIHISNVMLVCPSCKKATRVGFRTLEDGTKSRYCKSCDELID